MLGRAPDLRVWKRAFGFVVPLLWSAMVAQSRVWPEPTFFRGSWQQRRESAIVFLREGEAQLETHDTTATSVVGKARVDAKVTFRGGRTTAADSQPSGWQSASSNEPSGVLWDGCAGSSEYATASRKPNPSGETDRHRVWLVFGQKHPTDSWKVQILRDLADQADRRACRSLRGPAANRLRIGTQASGHSMSEQQAQGSNGHPAMATLLVMQRTLRWSKALRSRKRQRAPINCGNTGERGSARDQRREGTDLR